MDLPTISTRTMLELAMKAWGKEWNKPDTAYEFSGGRKFDSTDSTDSGVYEKD